MEIPNQHTRKIRLVHEDEVSFTVEGILRHKCGEVFVVYNESMEPILPFRLDELKRVEEVSSNGAKSEITSNLKAIRDYAEKRHVACRFRDVSVTSEDAKDLARSVSQPEVLPARPSVPPTAKSVPQNSVQKPKHRDFKSIAVNAAP